MAAFDIPPAFMPGPHHGVRPNLAFESLTPTAGGNDWVTATENALYQDGPPATLEHGSDCRVLVLDGTTGRARHQYVYRTEPIPVAPSPSGGAANNGLSGLLAYAPRRYIALERAYSAGHGNVIRLYLTTTRGARDVDGQDRIDPGHLRVMRKRLLLDVGRLGITPDNIEGLTFGPRINGRRTLVLVADNNFNTSQQTQFLAFVFDESAEPNEAFSSP